RFASPVPTWGGRSLVRLRSTCRNGVRTVVAATGLVAAVAGPVRAQAPRATEIAAGATVVLAHRGFRGPEVGVARRSGGQGRLTFGAACGSYERALGVRLGASAQFLLRPGERSGIGPYGGLGLDRKSTRLNSSHVSISYAVFCLKKKNT